DSLHALQPNERLALERIVRPFMSPAERRDLQSRAAGLPAQVRITVSDPLSYTEAADLVIARAGYNTTMEMLRSSTPALLIPRPGPSAEQRTRARLFQERGWVDALDPDEVNSGTLAEAIARGTHSAPRHRPV